jgi:surface antigen
MAVVGGLFAVAGLPAYAMNERQGADALAGSAGAKVATQNLVVDASTAALAPVRDGYSATSPEDFARMQRDALRAAQNAAYNASGARALGDDYPWAYELTVDQGGGLSPLNYFYRQCVDFVAWRLNRDAGSTQAPFKYVWSYLTPGGGDGSQWMYAWQQHGWPVSDVPIAGAVAYVGGNHVAYVKEVLDGGFVLLEEYNYVPESYSQRVIAASSVVAFLYPPPR